MGNRKTETKSDRGAGRRRSKTKKRKQKKGRRNYDPLDQHNKAQETYASETLNESVGAGRNAGEEDWRVILMSTSCRPVALPIISVAFCREETKIHCTTGLLWGAKAA